MMIRNTIRPSQTVPAAASQSARHPTASWVTLAGVALSMVYFAAPATAQLDCTQNCRPTVALVPFGALGSYQVDADGITVAAGDAVVLDVILTHWDADLDGSPLVSSFEIALDAPSLTTGTSGRLSAHTPTCNSMVDCDRQVRHYTRCVEGQCIPAFYDERRPQTIFPDTVTPFELAISAVGTRFTVVSPFAAEADTGVPTYAASIILQTSPDATGTFTVKVSELPGDAFLTGTDGSTIPIEVFAPAVIHVVPGEMFVPQSRALSFHAGLPGRAVAVRVTFVDLAPPFTSLNGMKMWVQEPRWVSRLPTTSYVHDVDPETPGMWVSELGCTLETWTKWAEFSHPIHIINEAIVPNSIYVLQTIDNISSFSSESYYSLPIRLTTPALGDVVGPLDPPSQTWTRPDGGVDISDIIAVLDVFRSAANAPVKTRVDFDPIVPDGIIDVLDIVRTLNAFSGLPYPFTPSVSSVCP